MILSFLVIIAIKTLFQLDNDIILKDVSEIEIARFCKGRILVQHVADIVGTKKKEKLLEKSEHFSAPSKTDKVLRKVFSVQETAKSFIQEHSNTVFQTPTLIVSKRASFICAVVAGTL